ncbi:hypothetical protein ACJMK2_028655 [Sinanodonta woodiana]|uniref:Uncharacterized protein n=2 Tax=Sinanodonta woodiana TaxID=1069815 RepID=A0ABD3XBC2_SINWO
MENKIDTFDEPDTDTNDDIKDECSMIRESDDSSYKSESDSMDSSFNSDTSEKSSEQPSTSLMSERKFIVFEQQLLSLFLTCHYCHGPAKGKVTNTIGTLIIITQECHLCSKSYTWSSQPYIGDMPAGNIILSGAILFAGATPTKVLRVMHHMCIPVIHLSTFMTHQRVLLTPTINKVWKAHQDRVFGELQSLHQPIAIAGDGRCDSPGHSAMFGAYSVLEVNLGKVLDIELVQSNEVNSSYHMEKEGLARAISKLQSHGVEVGTIITDRHVQIQKWVRENMTATHYFDVWHVAKGVKKKLEHIAKEKQCEDVRSWIKSISNHLYWCAASSEPGNGDLSVAKWHSVANHVQNRHTHANCLFPSCLHDCQPEANAHYKWLQSGTKACVKIEEVVLNQRLAKDIKKLSPIHQTSNLESFHSVVNHFAPKMLAFSYIGMRNRLHLAALHFNENANRPQAMTNSGTSRYQISFPKYKKGGYIVKEVKEDCTYKYVEELIAALEEMVKEPEPVDRQIPPPLCSQFQRPDKLNAVQAHKSRFAR